jgi:UDP-2-acetamido-2-deoxy-ribo-hexuluronate aminotransferase
MNTKMDFIDLKTQYQLIKEKIHQKMFNVLEHGQYIMGEEIFELEKKLADYVGVKHCVSVSSGTDSLYMALLALGIKSGDEVIIPTFTFFATGEVVKLLDAKPIFVDSDETCNIDPSKIEEKISAKTKAIMPVSLYGQCADFTKINEIAKKYNLSVIEDGAQSFGATHFGKKSCNLSTIGSTSFFPSKPLGCYGDGGAIFLNDDKLAEKMKQIRIHGQHGRYNHVTLGINGRLDTLQAAILLAKLEIFEDEIKRRQEIAARYINGLKDLVKIPTIKKENTSAYAQFTILVENRNEFQKKLNEQGIPTAIHYPTPLHKIKAMDYPIEDFPIADSYSQKVLSLPMHPYLNEKDQDKIIKVIKDSL